MPTMKAPRRGSTRTSPSCSSRTSAPRIGMRLTPNFCASAGSSRCRPAGSSPSTIARRIGSTIDSQSALRGAIVGSNDSSVALDTPSPKDILARTASSIQLTLYASRRERGESMSRARLSRRTVVAWLAAAALPLLAACGGAAPAATSAPARPTEPPAKPAGAAEPTRPAAAPAAATKPAEAAAKPAADATKPSVAAAPPAASAKPAGNLQGTRLTILAGEWFVPDTNKMLDEMVADLGKQTGMDARVERPGQQMAAKIATIIESGAGGDIFISADTDPFLYGEKLTDTTDVAGEIDKAW